MATTFCTIKCYQCGREAFLADRSYGSDVTCTNCGFSSSEQFVGSDAEDQDYLPTQRVHDFLAAGYLLKQGTTRDGAEVMYLMKTSAGAGVAHYPSSMHQFQEPLSLELEKQYMADNTITYLTKWDYQANCLVILKGEMPEQLF